MSTILRYEKLEYIREWRRKFGMAWTIFRCWVESELECLKAVKLTPLKMIRKENDNVKSSNNIRLITSHLLQFLTNHH